MGKNLRARNKSHKSKGAISPFPTAFFYPFGELSTVFVTFEIVVCVLFQFGRV